MENGDPQCELQCVGIDVSEERLPDLPENLGLPPALLLRRIASLGAYDGSMTDAIIVLRKPDR